MQATQTSIPWHPLRYIEPVFKSSIPAFGFKLKAYAILQETKALTAVKKKKHQKQTHDLKLLSCPCLCLHMYIFRNDRWSIFLILLQRRREEGLIVDWITKVSPPDVHHTPAPTVTLVFPFVELYFGEFKFASKESSCFELCRTR